MKLSTHLGRDRHDWMRESLRRRDNALVLVRVTASLPVGYRDVVPQRRVPTSLVVVLDRSGSMDGAPLAHAKEALRSVVSRLSPDDSFGLVTFDDEASVVVPAGPVTDRAAVTRAIDSVRAGSTTDLGAGLVRGLAEARRLGSEHGVRVLLVSDGHANRGVTDPEVLASHVTAQLAHGVTTSCLGMGLHYDELLLAAVARAGTGNEHFAAEADAAGGAVAAECGDLEARRFLSCRLTVVPATGIADVEVVNDLPVVDVPGGIQVDLGAMSLDATRSVVLECRPRSATRPGRRKVAEVRLDHVLADDLSDHHVSTRVWTQVRRPDEREGLVDRDVVGEWFVQRVLRRERRALGALARGALEDATRGLERVRRLALKAAPQVDAQHRRELLDKADEVEQHLQIIQGAAPDGLSELSKQAHVTNFRATRRRD